MFEKYETWKYMSQNFERKTKTYDNRSWLSYECDG